MFTNAASAYVNLCFILVMAVFAYTAYHFISNPEPNHPDRSASIPTSASSATSPVSSSSSSSASTATLDMVRKPLPNMQFLEFSLHEGSRAEITSTLLHLDQSVVVGSSKGKHGPHQSLFMSEKVKYLTKYPQAIHTVTSQRNHFVSNRDMEQIFYELKDDDVIKNTNAFICTNPMSFCESFLAFNRSIIWMAGHRYSAGRCHLKQWLKLNDNIFKSIEASSKKGKQAPLNVIAALSRYDAEYIEFFIGIRPIIFEPTASFYGTSHEIIDEDRYKKMHGYIKSIDEVKSKLTEKPSKARLKSLNEVIVAGKVVYKHNILYGPATMNDLPQQDATAFSAFASFYNLTFSEIRLEYSKFNLYDLAYHPAMIIFPYTTHSHLIAEIYSMGIPLFIPSIPFLAKMNLIDDNDCNGPHTMNAAHPDKHEDTIHGDRSPESHDGLDVEYWLQFTMYYQWPHITTFNSWKELMELFSNAFTSGNTFLIDTHNKMMDYNQRRIKESLTTWSTLISNISAYDKHQLRQIPSNYTAALRSIYDIDSIQD